LLKGKENDLKRAIIFVAFLSIILSLFGAPILIYFRPGGFILIFIAGALGVIFGFSLYHIFITKKNILKVSIWWMPIIYILLIVLVSWILNLKHNNLNLPSPLPCFNKDRILSRVVKDSSQDKSNELTLDILQSYFKHRPKNLIFGFFDSVDTSSKEEIISKADSLLLSYYQYLSYPSVKLSKDVTWTEHFFNDPSWNFRLHVMDYLYTLVNAYRQTDNLRYLKRAEELILDWISDNSDYYFLPPSDFSWGDHSTALRLTNWLYFWEEWSKSSLFTSSKMKLVLSSIVAHAERLANPKFYNYHHNHGISQDIALLSATSVFPEIGKSTEWRRLACNRLKDQINFAISPNGVHLEHSPGYHFYGLEQIQEINILLNDMNLKDDFDIDLEELITKMIRYVKYIVQPNGKIATIGDTGPGNIKKFISLLEPFIDKDNGLEYILTNGNSGSLSDTAISFKDEGYAIIRDSNGDKIPFEKSFYLFFTTAANKGRDHKHSDELSFILSYGGYDLLIDPGYYSYKNDEYRTFIISPKAHNTITVDEKNNDGWNKTFEKFYNDSIYTLIQVSHRNFSGFECRRRLIRVRQNILIVVDEIKPYPYNDESTDIGLHKFKQIFHSSRDINIQVIDHDKEVWFSPQGSKNPAMRIMQLGTEKTSLKIYKGSKNPIQGWSTKSHGILEPVPVIEYEQTGKNATFITAIELNKTLVDKNLKDFIWAVFSYNPDKRLIHIDRTENSLREQIIIDLNKMEVVVH